MRLERKYVPALILAVVVISIFGIVFLRKHNYEFCIYVGVVIFFMWAVLASCNRVRYPVPAFYGLTLWAILHMAGGGLYIGATRLYDYILIPLSQTYPVLRYDQVVHAFGFAVATYVFYCVLRSSLRTDARLGVGLAFCIVLMGNGAGALNEIIEFFVSQVCDAGVGGYVNTSLDLVSNFIGSLLAVALIRARILP